MWLVNTLLIVSVAFLLVFGPPITERIQASRNHTSSKEKP